MDIKASEFFAVTNKEGRSKSGTKKKINDEKPWFNYRAFVRKQLEPMKVDDVIIADIGKKTIKAFRMNLDAEGKKAGKKFRTKVVDGELYVGRMK